MYYCFVNNVFAIRVITILILAQKIFLVFAENQQTFAKRHHEAQRAASKTELIVFYDDLSLENGKNSLVSKYLLT